MITAALVTFAVLGLAWLVAPGDRVAAGRVRAPEPRTDDQAVTHAEAA